MLDRLPASVRHLVIMLAAGVLAYGLPVVESNYTSWNLPAPLIAALGIALPYASLWLTGLTTQYGVAAPAPVVGDPNTTVG